MIRLMHRGRPPQTASSWGAGRDFLFLSHHSHIGSWRQGFQHGAASHTGTFFFSPLLSFTCEKCGSLHLALKERSDKIECVKQV